MRFSKKRTDESYTVMSRMKNTAAIFTYSHIDLIGFKCYNSERKL